MISMRRGVPKPRTGRTRIAQGKASPTSAALGLTSAKFPPSPPADGGEGWGEEALRAIQRSYVIEYSWRKRPVYYIHVEAAIGKQSVLRWDKRMSALRITIPSVPATLGFFAALLLSSSSLGQPLRIDHIPTNTPAIAIEWRCDGPGPLAPRIVTRIWREGVAIWSTNLQPPTIAPEQVSPGGPPYFRGRIDPQKISDFLNEIKMRGYFDKQKTLKQPPLLIDGTYWVITVRDTDQTFVLRSDLDFRRVTAKSLLENEGPPGSLRQFSEAWKLTVDGIQGLIPPSGTVMNLPESLPGRLRSFTEIIEHLDPWPDDPGPDPPPPFQKRPLYYEKRPLHYADTNWSALVSAAKLVQQGAPSVVEDVLRGFQELHYSTASDSKLLLLMRVAFDLPEDRPLGRRVGFGGWVHLNDSFRTNAAWPILWNSGNPRLVVGFVGLQGRRYDAAAEYRDFEGRFPKRDLTTFKE